jgi:RimJ/RimL family protein N-acetyltransferase
VRAAELSGELAIRWRARGTAGSPEQWTQLLWQAILSQYVIVNSKDGRLLGIVCAYRPDFQDGFCYIGVASFGTTLPSPAVVFGGALFIDYVFACWNFHKLYLETPEFNMSQIGSAIGRLFHVEGQFRNHLWYGGRRWDQFTLALYRETWAQGSGKMLQAARSSPQATARIRLPRDR